MFIVVDATFFISVKIDELEGKVAFQSSIVQELFDKSGSNEQKVGELKNTHKEIRSKPNKVFFKKKMISNQ